MADDEFTKMHTQWMESTKSADGKSYKIEKELANETINYIIRQVNDFSKLSIINYEQYTSMLRKAEYGLFILIFVTYYDDNIVDKIPVHTSASNLMKLMYNKILNGNEYKLELERIKASQQMVIARSQ